MNQKRITTQMELIGFPVSVAPAKTNHNQFPVVEIGAPPGGLKCCCTLARFNTSKQYCPKRLEIEVKV